MKMHFLIRDTDLSTPKTFAADYLARVLRNGKAHSEYRFSASQ